MLNWKHQETTRIFFQVQDAQASNVAGGIRAFMTVLGAGYTWNDSRSTRLAFEWAHASGDDNNADNKRETFDNLYPTNHLHYGFMDRVSLQNIDNYRLQLSAKPQSNLKVQLDYHFFYLDTVNDSLYAANRAAIRTAATTGVSDHVGNEIDLLLKYKANANLSYLAGYSRFSAGDFLKNTGSGDDGDYFYIQTTLKL